MYWRVKKLPAIRIGVVWMVPYKKILVPENNQISGVF